VTTTGSADDTSTDTDTDTAIDTATDSETATATATLGFYEETLIFQTSSFEILN
jgi:hypothetical protein